MSDASPHTIAVVGAGPAGLYATRKLAQAGHTVLLLNRDLKPGGLAEYGIYHTKHKMKEGLRKQFRKILALPNVHYYGGVQVGDVYPVKLQELYDLGCSVVLFTIGAQGTKMLGFPGEENATGVFHAKDIVYHFNQLPPFANQHFAVGKKVGIIGMGNVMLDVAHWLVCDKHVEQVVVIARRGPAERAYTDKEMREVAMNLDQDDLKAEFERITPYLKEVGQDPDALYEAMLAPLAKAKETNSPTKLVFRFLCSTKQILTDENDRVKGLEVEYNKLVPKGESLRPQGTGEQAELDIDTLVYAIGDQVDSQVGLPFEWGKYIVPSEPHPTEPERARYEVFDPAKEEVIPGVFVGGWARIASDGLVGKARADGETAADEVMAFLENNKPEGRSWDDVKQQLEAHLQAANLPLFTNEQVQQLEAIEQAKAAEEERDFFKFNTNEEMLDVLKN